MTHAEQVDIENRLHDKYFAPFDQLLERKAEYYLRRVDEIGEEKCRPMLREIEVLERFREYAVMMQNIQQQASDTIYVLSGMVSDLKKESADYEFLWYAAMKLALHWETQMPTADHLKRLQ